MLHKKSPFGQKKRITLTAQNNVYNSLASCTFSLWCLRGSCIFSTNQHKFKETRRRRKFWTDECNVNIILV